MSVSRSNHKTAKSSGPTKTSPAASASECKANGRMSIVPGPTYGEMRDPRQIDSSVTRRARRALTENELDPVNLFNIHWYDQSGHVRYIVLPRELTGVNANILVLIGSGFPSGSHKVGPAYSTLIEGEIKGEIRPGEKTILGPSTGNFGIGTAYVSTLKGYRAIIIMPDSMSFERYERIRKYGGMLELTPGTESDVILTLEKTYELKKDPDNYTLAQFELLPNYRFHRYVTGAACLAAAREVGDGRIACFVSAPGSAGTLAAGDEIKSVFNDCSVVAMEPRQCATLYDNLRGQHRIEGIGDKMVTLIHNVLTTDYVCLVHDDDCLVGLKLLQDGARILERSFGVSAKVARSLVGIFGISGIGNILASIKMARYLDLSARETVVTVATDGFDRYPSVMVDLGKRMGRLGDGAIDDRLLARWGKDAFHGADAEEILDVRGSAQKDRLYKQKAQMWTRFGYSRAYLDQMKKMDFWEKEYKEIPAIDREIAALRG